VKERDFALAEDEKSGQVIIHRADCPTVRAQAARGRPVITLFGAKKLPHYLEVHSCMREKR
jgi:hypothetical protein